MGKSKQFKEYRIQNVIVNNDKYIKAKVKSYGSKINTNFQDKIIPKENASYKCLSLIMLDSVIRVNNKYYHQTLLQEYKYVIKNNKIENLINDDLDLSSSDNELMINSVMSLMMNLKINLMMTNVYPFSLPYIKNGD